MSIDFGLRTLFERDSPEKAEKDKDLGFCCPHYFGYLSKRGRDIDFPDECLVCPNVVNCIFVPSDSLNADLYVKAVKEKEIRELAQFL
jgi:hypothetical protein